MDLPRQTEQPGPVRPDGSLNIDTSIYYDKPDAPNTGEKFVVFSLNEDLFAVAAEKIAEVTHPLSIAPLPGTHGRVLGLANLRGEIIAVMNLKKMWNEKNFAPPEKAKLIVLRSGSAETPLAFQVDKLNEIVTLSDSEIRPSAKGGPGQIYGVAERGPDKLHLLDTDKLRASLAFD